MKPCRDENGNVCVAEGCYGEACVEQEEPEFWDVVGRTLEVEIRKLIREELENDRIRRNT